jgi:site-specific recombinase XerD
MVAAGIAWRARHLTPHSFRHSLNTLLLDAGVDAAKIRAALGWTSTGVQDGYTHWGAGHLRDLAEAFDQVIP